MMFWMDGWKLGSAWLANVTALQETLFAAQRVIAHRTPIMETAMRRPLDADLAELCRMGTEKLDVFGKAGASLAESWQGLSGQIVAQANDITSLMTSGWPPNTKTIGRIGRRGSALLLGAGMAPGLAFAPFHAAVTDNQRRLTRAGKRKKR